jgi:lysophospholipase L1-like esterase
MRLMATLGIFTLAFSTISTFGAEPTTRKTRQAGKPKPKPTTARVKDDPLLPRVLLIGDSISQGYTKPVQTLLQGKANVHRIPDNGQTTSYGLANLKKWLGQGKWDVIHFNWGLHDIKIGADGKHQVPIDQYEKNLVDLVKELKTTGARLVWASTTPVPDGALKPSRKRGDEVAYNEVARKIMDQNGVAIDDLYTFALPRLAEIQQPVNVHFTPKGYEALAERVVASIQPLPAKPARSADKAAETQPKKGKGGKRQPAKTKG